MSERYFMRKADLAYILVILTLCGAVWAGIKVPMKWEQTTKDVENIKPRLEHLELAHAELDARNTTQMTLIIRELDGIHRELKGWKNQVSTVNTAEKG